VTDFLIGIECSLCGQPHRLPLDASGHYSGSLPCDPETLVDLQVNPEEFRRISETEQAKVQH
jgi:hypothetical protein